MRAALGILACLLASSRAATWTCSASLGAVEVDQSTGVYSISVGGSEWFSNGDVAYTSNKVLYSASGGTLHLQSSTASSGVDNQLGAFEQLSLSWTASTTPPVSTIFRCYDMGLATFTFVAPEGIQDTNMTVITPAGPSPGGEPPTTRFPSFGTAGSPLGTTLRHLNHAGPWTLFEQFGTGIGNGPRGQRGPYYFVNDTIAATVAGVGPDTATVAILSPMDNFFDSQWGLAQSPEQFFLGVQASAKFIPAGYNYTACLWTGDRGMTTETYAWGEVMQLAHGTNHSRISAKDPVVSKISAWTDNGAVYFQSYWDTHCPTRNCTANGTSTPQETLLSWNSFLTQAMDIPIAITQLDTWWFVQGADVDPSGQGGIDCADWVPRPDMFPAGIQYVTDKIALILYSWGYVHPSDGNQMTNYTWQPQLGTQHKSMVALNETLSFFTMIRDRFLTFGGTSFEQDNMGQMTQQYEHSINQTGGAQRWFEGFATPFCEADIPVQICESSPAEILETLKHDCITNSRDNIDHVPGQHSGNFVNRWHVGFDRPFMDALGIKPYFDNTWTVPVQPESTWGESAENYTELSWALSVLGSGPVGIGDGLGYTNSTLAHTAIDASGSILKPSRASAYIDAVYVSPEKALINVSSSRVFQAPAFISTAGQAAALFNSSKRALGNAPLGTETFTTVLGVDINTVFNLSLAYLQPAMSRPQYQVVPWAAGFEAIDQRCGNGAPLSGCAQPVTPASGLSIETGKAAVPWAHDFELYSFSPDPCAGNGFVLLGELTKIVRVSSVRFSALKWTCATDEQTGGATLQVTVSTPQSKPVDIAIAAPKSSSATDATVIRVAAAVAGADQVVVTCTDAAPAPSCSVTAF